MSKSLTPVTVGGNQDLMESVGQNKPEHVGLDVQALVLWQVMVPLLPSWQL